MLGKHQSSSLTESGHKAQQNTFEQRTGIGMIGGELEMVLILETPFGYHPAHATDSNGYPDHVNQVKLFT